jgi:acyl-CoA reductase-like NAD-dependent aldehyde dehydrogenase
VGLPLETLESYANHARSFCFEERIGNSLVVKEPAGVVVAITPWNYPLYQIIAKVAPALAAGCTIVLKPSEVTPLNAFLLADIIDRVGLPAGVFNLVSGSGLVVGERLAGHENVDLISFTGSTRAGKRVAQPASSASLWSWEENLLL